jgi:hypothetical protein
MGCRLLAGLDANRLREHIQGNGFMPWFEFAIAAKAMHVFQDILLAEDCR